MTPDEVAELRQRCTAAEGEVERLTAELAEARSALARYEQEPGGDPAAAAAGTGLGLFERPSAAAGLTGDGSDPRVLSVILTATAVVTGMVAVLALINGTLFSPFGIVIMVLTAVLTWAALRTRVETVEVSVNRGIVYIDQGDTSHRFDIRGAKSTVEMQGQPGDSGWQVRFLRRGMDPFVVDSSMVDPHDFVRQLHQFRPEL